ncbi:exodeoxyribonuclease V, 135 kDa subunit [Lentisphaera araneosa HTCC2155]|uniref:DNA 3'-5' helicase n=1 Tax=Lentisphaera araneosa HTCC2155 TaxID=313628 RepID=A6DNF2_9BACT|nr:exodeoxyribonuclease V subunit beta [Lentisphaera araneosa]EDM26900.1 exodeoxyribonuclease V, 135 kDa subunit [Lentisphaera araneosa HTCC2155]
MMQPLDLTQPIKDSGITLIEASAGTGKTYSIANIFLHFILKGRDVSEILVVTFTEDATKELRDRVRKNLSKALLQIRGDVTEEDPTLKAIIEIYPHQDENRRRLELALVNFDQAVISTIHGFCQRMLKENAFESHSTFDMELVTDDSKLIDELVEDFIRIESYDHQSAFNYDAEQLKSLIKLYKGQAIEEAEEFDLEARKQKFIELYKAHGHDQIEVLQNNKGMSRTQKNPYLLSKFPDYIEHLKLYCKGDERPTALKAIVALSQSSINSNMKSKKVPPTHELFEAADQLAECYSDKFIKQRFLKSFREKYEAKKEKLNVMTFDDLIIKLHEALVRDQANGPLHSLIRDNFKVALVDEFQDTDPIQYQIFKSLFGDKSHATEHAFYMIGDPKQSIYRFRGADIFAYLQAKNDADEQFTLQDNYRSEAAMVDAVNHFFSQRGADEAFAFAPAHESEGITFEPVGAKADKNTLKITGQPESLQLRWYRADEDKDLSKTDLQNLMPSLVTEEIISLLNKSQQGSAYFESEEKQALKPGDICILVNKNNQATAMKQSLNENGIPAVVAKSGNVFKSAEANALERFLNAVIDPKDSSLIPLLLSELFTLTAEEIKELGDQERFELLTEFVDYHREWEKRGFLRTLQKFIDRHQLYTRTLEQDQGERSLSNLYQLREILHEEEQSKGLGPSGLLRFLQEKTQADKVDDQYLQRLETDDNAVKIMTIHKSKGLEFPVVFCPYMWSESFEESSYGSFGESNKKNDFEYHDDSRLASLSIDPDEEFRQEKRYLWRREILSEKLRLLYVALTRSAHRCYLYWGDVNVSNTPFEYLANPEVTGADIADGTSTKLDSSQRRSIWQDQVANTSHTKFCELGNIDQMSPCFYRPKNDLELRKPKELKFEFPIWVDGSYSGLIRSHDKVQFTPDQAPLDDEGEKIPNAEPEEEIIPEGFFAFPRGAVPGTCIHEIFEHIDFQDERGWEEIIADRLKHYQLHETELANQEEFFAKRIADCKDMLRKVLSTTLVHNDFALDSIPRHQRLDELEFHYPVKDIQLKKLQKLFLAHYSDGFPHDYSLDLEKLNYRMEEGYFNGSIDLSFQKDGKFYIVDWKSNYLGPRYEDYHGEALQRAVREHFYFLQYHIYTLAFHLYLEKYLAGYDYDQHFGACIYLFVRGVEPGAQSGMHYDRVPKALVEDMKKLILEGEFKDV